MDFFNLPPYDTRILGTVDNQTLAIPYYYLSDEDTILFLVSVLRNQLEIALLANNECHGIRRSYFRKILCDLFLNNKI